MLRKTRIKLQRRFVILPLHHIDTSVILGSENAEEENIRKKYIQKLGYNYRGVASFPVLSELFVKFLLLRAMEERDVFTQFMDHLRDRRKIEFYSPRRIGKLTEEIYDLDKRLEPTDIQIIACTIENKADVLVTLDKNLIDHKIIKEKYGLKIAHPKDFI